MGVLPFSLCVFCGLTTVSPGQPRGEYSGSMGYPGPLLRAIRSLYTPSESCVSIFSVELHEGCPLSPLLFVIFMDISRRSQGEKRVRFGNLRIAICMSRGSVDLQHALKQFAAEK